MVLLAFAVTPRHGVNYFALFSRAISPRARIYLSLECIGCSFLCTLLVWFSWCTYVLPVHFIGFLGAHYVFSSALIVILVHTMFYPCALLFC